MVVTRQLYEHLRGENKRLRAQNAEMLGALKAIFAGYEEDSLNYELLRAVIARVENNE